MVLLLTALMATAAPAPSSSVPPPTIVHETVYPICTVLRSNLGHSIQAVVANDQAIEASKPLIMNMAQNAGSFGAVSQNGLGNLHGPAALSDDSAGSVLDTNRLERVIGTLQHNIEIIKHELSDPSRFPADPQTSSDRQAVRLKGLLQDVLTQQEMLLNVYEGLLDTRQTTSLAGSGDPLQQLFHVDTPEVQSKGSLDPLAPGSIQGGGGKPQYGTFQNPKTEGGNTSLVSGVLSPLPSQRYNPEFGKSSIPGLEKSIYGRFYQAVDLEQSRINFIESALAIKIITTTRECNHAPAVERP